MHLLGFLLAVGIAVSVGRVTLSLVTVNGESMAPNLHHGDRLLAVRWVGLPARLLVGRVVVADLPAPLRVADGSRVLVKRVTAVRSEQVWLQGDAQNSLDSRHFGWLDGSCVTALVLVRLRRASD